MNLLLDTQVLIWSLAADRRLKSTARRAIEDGSNRVWVSAASAWEIEIKTALGKLRVPDDLLTQMTAVKFEELPVRIEHALYLRRLPALHRDPFDRILIARALCERLTLVTTDAILHGSSLTPRIQTLLKPTVCLLLMTRCTRFGIVRR